MILKNSEAADVAVVSEDEDGDDGHDYFEVEEVKGECVL